MLTVPLLDISLPINLPPFILAHATLLLSLGLSSLVNSTSNGTSSGAYGITLTALGLAYFATSYMPIEQNQFLYASVPVRLILALLATGKALTMDSKTAETKKDKMVLWFIVVLDGVGGGFLGWWLGEFGGRVPGS